MSFAENLKQLRKEKQLSQEELAEILDVSRQAVSKWEQGIGYPEVEKLMSISSKLNISLDSLTDSSEHGFCRYEEWLNAHNNESFLHYGKNDTSILCGGTEHE